MAPTPSPPLAPALHRVVVCAPHPPPAPALNQCWWIVMSTQIINYQKKIRFVLSAHGSFPKSKNVYIEETPPPFLYKDMQCLR